MDFLKNNFRFDFRYGDKPCQSLNPLSEQKEEGNTLTTVYTFPDGLKVTNIAKKYEKHGAYEWVNIFENTSSESTEIISELWDCSVVLPFPHENPREMTAYIPSPETATQVFSPSGSAWGYDEFYTDTSLRVHGYNHLIYPGDTKEYKTYGGKSSDSEAPFFNIHKNGIGAIFAVGWSGQWKAEISRSEDTITFKSKIEDTHFRLYPGEKIRTSSVVMLPYEGSITDSQNKWRRLVKEEFSLIGKEGREKYGPFCAGIWGGMSTKAALERIDVIKKNNLPFEYIWMDAGWYGTDPSPSPDEFEGAWYQHTGDWRVNPHHHPDGLKEVTAAIHEAGMKFLLWFEPERVICTTPIVSAHPEYFLAATNENDNSRILNLGNPDAWEYCYNTLAGQIEELRIDCYRQDFNISPLDAWRKNDGVDRRGITEIKHIMGLYRLWDALLERFPHLIIDNCASGGRRIDIETLRRSMPMWRSDVQCPANFPEHMSQIHNLTYNAWMPYSGTGSGRFYSTYRFRSCHGASMTTNYTFSERDSFGDDPEKIKWLKKCGEEYLKIRPYFSEDFYPLTEVCDKTDVWCATQFDRPSGNDGIIQVFRRENSPYETAIFRLGGINEAAVYTISDIDGGDDITVSGAELAEKGFSVKISEPCTAKIYIYSYKN